MRRSSWLFHSNNSPTKGFSALLEAIKVPADTLDGIDAALQERFFPKTAAGTNVERWQLPPVDVGGCSLEDFRRHLANIEYWKATKPPMQRYIYGAVPGAAAVRVVGRMDDLITAWDQGVRWEETVLFGGERPLDEKIDGLPKLQEAFAPFGTFDVSQFSRLGDDLPKTEYGLMQLCWNVLSEIGRLPAALFETKTTFVNAPMKQGKTPDAPKQRPQTEDPLVEWLANDDPEPGSMLVSCGTPYATSMSIAFESVLGRVGFSEIDFFGHGTPETLGPEVIMREIAGAVHRYAELVRRKELAGA